MDRQGIKNSKEQDEKKVEFMVWLRFEGSVEGTSSEIDL